eukprot:1292758-Pyramimonas_sp.AAC.1
MQTAAMSSRTHHMLSSTGGPSDEHHYMVCSSGVVRKETGGHLVRGWIRVWIQHPRDKEMRMVYRPVGCHHPYA